MNVAVHYDPTDLKDILRARDYLNGQAAQLDVTFNLRLALEEILALGSGGDYLRLIRKTNLPTFSLKQLSIASGVELSTIHAMAANFGKAAAHRRISIFEAAGNSKALSPDAARILNDLLDDDGAMKVN